MKTNMNPDIRNAVIIGVLFILTAIIAIIGLGLYVPILNDPDNIIKGSANEIQVIGKHFLSWSLPFQ